VFENHQVLLPVPLFAQPGRPLWEQYFEQAMGELDSNKILPLIHETEKALLVRGLEMGSDDVHNDEREAMGSACNDLAAMKIRKLGWPDPCD
jgi:hypothetical protein